MTWVEFAQAAGPQALEGFKRVWFEKKWPLPEQEKILRELFLREPLGQTNFKMWLRNTTRNLLAQEISYNIKANNGAAASILNKA